MEFLYCGRVLICIKPFVTCASQVVKLYERCLIACANYPEYWIRYVSCMETSGSLDLADNALARATQVFVKVKSHKFFPILPPCDYIGLFNMRFYLLLGGQFMNHMHDGYFYF